MYVCKAAAKDLTLQVKYPDFETLPSDFCIRVDREKMCRAVSCLISNAVKFTPSGGRVTVSCKLVDKTIFRVMDLHKRRGRVVKKLLIEVSDTGIGLTQV